MTSLPLQTIHHRPYRSRADKYRRPLEHKSEAIVSRLETEEAPTVDFRSVSHRFPVIAGQSKLWP